MGFDPAWLAVRQRYDETALDPAAVQAIRSWGTALPSGYAPVVVDLGSGMGAALERVQQWLAPRRLVGYAVDQDAALLAQARTLDGDHAPATPLVGDLLEPLARLGGPPDGSVDLVVGHALADLLPLDRLAARVATLLRPGGLAHLALAYDGPTTFMPALDAQTYDLETAVLAAFHRHMDRPRAATPSYGGSTSGRRLGAALTAAGLEIVADGPSVWQVRASDGAEGQQVLAWLIRFVAEAAREIGGVSERDLARWENARRSALAAGTLAAQVGHRDVLGRAPGIHAPGSLTPG